VKGLLETKTFAAVFQLPQNLIMNIHMPSSSKPGAKDTEMRCGVRAGTARSERPPRSVEISFKAGFRAQELSLWDDMAPSQAAVPALPSGSRHALHSTTVAGAAPVSRKA